MNGWSWDGTAPGSAACGMSDDETRARRSAEAWLAENPGGAARLGPVVLADLSTVLSPWWAPAGDVEVSRRLADGSIAWERPVPALVAAARLGRPRAEGLSDREREVAGLAVTGLTSAQIGRQLFISQRTVDTHLRKIYRKTGTGSSSGARSSSARVRLANWLAGQDAVGAAPVDSGQGAGADLEPWLAEHLDADMAESLAIQDAGMGAWLAEHSAPDPGQAARARQEAQDGDAAMGRP